MQQSYSCVHQTTYPKGVFTPGKSASSLLWSGPNTMLIFFIVGAVCFHTALFASEPEIVKNKQKKNTCTKVIHSLVHPFNRTRVRLVADQNHLFSCALVRLFGAHLSAIAAPINLVQSNQTRPMWIHPYSDKDPDFKASQSDWSLPFLSIIESLRTELLRRIKQADGVNSGTDLHVSMTGSHF